jgi:hypothetical protein
MRTKRQIIYHGRAGHPEIHKTAGGRKYIMVRAEGGGTKRLYNGARYYEEPTRRKGKRTYKILVL